MFYSIMNGDVEINLHAIVAAHRTPVGYELYLLDNKTYPVNASQFAAIRTLLNAAPHTTPVQFPTQFTFQGIVEATP